MAVGISPIKVPKSTIGEPNAIQAFGTPDGQQTKASVVSPGVTSPTGVPVISNPGGTPQKPTVAKPVVGSQTPQPTTPTKTSVPRPPASEGSTVAKGTAPAGAPDPGMPNTTGTGTPPVIANPGGEPQPSTPPVPPIPGAPGVGLEPTPGSIGRLSNAREAEQQIEAEQQRAMYEAALHYGSREAEALYGVPTANPISALEVSKLKAAREDETSVNNRGLAGTIESSLRANDQRKIGETTADRDLEAYQLYQKSIADANANIQKAKAAYLTEELRAREEEAAAAEKREPEKGAVGTESPNKPIVSSSEEQPQSLGTRQAPPPNLKVASKVQQPKTEGAGKETKGSGKKAAAEALKDKAKKEKGKK